MRRVVRRGGLRDEPSHDESRRAAAGQRVPSDAPTRTIGRGEPVAPKATTPTRQAARRLAPETRLMCLIEQAAGVLCRSLRLRMAPRDDQGRMP